MRKAKIICTLGPASDHPEIIEAMIEAGMDVARLNFSHGTPEEHQRRAGWVRKLARKLGRPVALLQDIQGPKLRLGAFEGGQLAVKAGQEVILTPRNVRGGGSVLPAPIPFLSKTLRPKDAVLIDDGRVRLEVLRIRGREAICRVRVGGVVKDHKGINLPGAHLAVRSITRKDVKDLAFGQQLGVDYVAVSFVRSPEDVLRAKSYLRKRKTPVIAKIEKPQAVEALEEIAAVSTGLMVARGDLGVELPLEQLPGIQKAAVLKANQLGKLAIVATEMLESMGQSIRPTRAEVSDVANAILDGADAVMLSGETAAGKYPVEAVQTMARIVEETERSAHATTRRATLKRTADISTGVAAASAAACAELGISTVVAYTESGYTARLISALRPSSQILGLTPNPEVVARMALYWGVQGRLVGRHYSTDAMIRQVRQICRTELECKPGTPVVILAGVPLNQPGNTNTLSIHRV